MATTVRFGDSQCSAMKVTCTSIGPIFLLTLILFPMHVEKKVSKALSLSVTENLTVTVLPTTTHEYVMTTKEVALGYGTSKYAIQQALHRNNSEFIKGKHFETALTICQHDLKMPHNSILWTKRGIVRLGFFIKSERAKLFRDWAEELVLSKLAQPTLFDVKPINALPERRNYYNNRLTHERLLDIMTEVCKIEDKEVRMNITSKLMGGREVC